MLVVRWRNEPRRYNRETNDHYGEFDMSRGGGWAVGRGAGGRAGNRAATPPSPESINARSKYFATFPPVHMIAFLFLSHLSSL